MRRLAVAACAAAVLAGLAPAAHAFPPNATDRGCSLVTVPDASTGTAGAQFGYLFGGPIRQDGTLLCSAKVDLNSHTEPAFQGGSASVTGSNGVTQMPPMPVSFTANDFSSVFVCSRFTDAGGVTYYWNGDARVWTTNSGVPCALATTFGTSDPIFEPAFEVLGLVDALLCDTLKVLHPLFYPTDPLYVAADGDLYVLGLRVWDCAPMTGGNRTTRAFLYVFPGT